MNLISTNMVGEFVKWTNSPLRLAKYGLICLFGFGKNGGAAFDKTLTAPGQGMTKCNNCSSNAIIWTQNMQRIFETHKCPPPHPRLKKAIGILREQGSVGTPRTSDYMRAKSVANAIIPPRLVPRGRPQQGVMRLK